MVGMSDNEVKLLEWLSSSTALPCSSAYTVGTLGGQFNKGTATIRKQEDLYICTVEADKQEIVQNFKDLSHIFIFKNTAWLIFTTPVWDTSFEVMIFYPQLPDDVYTNVEPDVLDLDWDTQYVREPTKWTLKDFIACVSITVLFYLVLGCFFVALPFIVVFGSLKK